MKRWLKKHKNILLLIGVLSILAFFLVPFSIAPVVETIQWKGNTVDVISVVEREGQFSFSNGESLSISASASQGRNAEIRSKQAEVTLDFKSIDISKYETVEIILNGKASVADPPQRMGANSGLTVGLKNNKVCSKGADITNTPISMSLFKIENKGGGFYRLITDCGTELIQTKDSEIITPYISVSAQTTSGALEHSATSSLTIYEIRLGKEITPTSPALEIQPITEIVQEIAPIKEQQVELIAESSLTTQEKEQVVTMIAGDDKSKQDQLLALLTQIETEKVEKQQRNLYIIIGGLVVLSIATLSLILVRKKRR